MYNKLNRHLCWLLLLLLPTFGLSDTAIRSLGQSKDTMSPSANVYTWRPTSGGLARFEFLFPETALHQSIKYNDTNALFYMSKLNDEGISPDANRQLKVKIAYGNLRSQLEASFPVSHTTDLNLGLSYLENEIDPYVGVKHSYYNETLSISSISAAIENDSLSVNLETFTLSELNNFEYFYGLNLSYDTSSNISAYAGLRKFDFMNTFDLSGEVLVAQQSQDLRLKLQMPQDKYDPYISCWNIFHATGPNCGLGVSISLNPKLQIIAENNQPSASSAYYNKARKHITLKAMRQRSLSNIWRINVHRLTPKPFNSLRSDQQQVLTMGH